MESSPPPTERPSGQPVLDLLLRYVSLPELLAIRRVSRHARVAATRYLITRFASVRGASSVIAAQYTRRTLQQTIVDHLEAIARARGTAHIASDQIGDARFFNGLLSPSLTVVLNVGHAPDRGLRGHRGNVQQVDGPSQYGKAHTKFIAGGGHVFLGSPNLTPTALSGTTVESAVVVSNPLIQGYFRRYHALMRARTPDDTRVFREMLEAFNAANTPMSLALAPFVSVQPWLLTQLAGYDRIVIRMFLISYLKRGADIVDGLNRIARNNPDVTIDVYVDEGQVNESWEKQREDRDEFIDFFGTDRSGREVGYRRHYYVHEACQRLMDGTKGNVRVHTQSGTGGIMHDKLILAERDVGTSPEGGKLVHKRVIIGSSGFSSHVMQNENFDLMVRIDQDALYDYMMAHHTHTTSTKAFKTTLLPHLD